jgi:hypothetical protein
MPLNSEIMSLLLDKDALARLGDEAVLDGERRDCRGGGDDDDDGDDTAIKEKAKVKLLLFIAHKNTTRNATRTEDNLLFCIMSRRLSRTLSTELRCVE